MTDDQSALVRSYAERLDRLQCEKSALADDIKEVLAEAEDKGLDKKALQKAVKEYQAGDEAKVLRRRVEQYLLALEAPARSSAKSMKVGGGVEASA